MSLLNDLVQEMAAAGSTGAANIAANPYTSAGSAPSRSGGSLFGGGVVDMKKEDKKRRKMIRRLGIKESKKLSFIQALLSETLGVDLGGTDFDASDVISRIEAASKKEEQNEDTVVFGMEDEDGNMVKVYVRADQADEFEKKLAIMLAGQDEDEDEDNSALEIAEVLFKLKDEFEIVDVEWPSIEGDKEEEQEMAVSSDASSAGTASGDLPPEGGEAPEGESGGDMENLDGEGEGAEDMSMDDSSAAKSALDSVIDMMKADAEAKKAEADARAAEARAKEAEFAAQAAASKIRKEEQVFDMEASEKAAKEQEKEAQQLAKLARFQHQKAQDAEVKLSMESKEEHQYKYDDPYITRHEKSKEDEDDNELTLNELTHLIMRNLSHNGK